ncbi:MAG TPA: hypothetical protein ENN29_13390 [Candidatus Hydrogenedentes bacterium]|nr:hypothetical protein [Candidatus Hydrogenedentota bacterium]
MKQHFWPFFLTVAAVSITVLQGGYADYAPIPIGSIEELQRIGRDEDYPLNGYYILTRDIEAEHTSYWDGGAGFAPIGWRLEEDDSLAFNGWFDGQGFTIRGLVINRPTEHGIGLFGSIGGAAVVVNVGLEGGTITGGHYVGALVGENWSQEIAACYASVEVNGVSRVGGLAGINRGLISGCYATGTVSGEEYVGGLIGRNYEGVVQECHAAGAVAGVARAGGLVGETIEGAVYDSFWDTETSGQIVSDGGLGLTAGQMTQRNIYVEAGWDFFALWQIAPGHRYPRFQYQR